LPPSAKEPDANDSPIEAFGKRYRDLLCSMGYHDRMKHFIRDTIILFLLAWLVAPVVGLLLLLILLAFLG